MSKEQGREIAAFVLTALAGVDQVLREQGFTEDATARHQLAMAVSALKGLLSASAAMIERLRADGPVIRNGSFGDGDPRFTTMRVAPNEALQAASVEADEADKARTMIERLSADRDLEKKWRKDAEERAHDAEAALSALREQPERADVALVPTVFRNICETCEGMGYREQPMQLNGVCYACGHGHTHEMHLDDALREQPESWKCGALSGNTGANDPQDCNWPVCGCDPYAGKVIAALEESGLLREQQQQPNEDFSPASTPSVSQGEVTTRTDCVICPNCVHQFVAIPVDVQERLVSLERIEINRDALERDYAALSSARENVSEKRERDEKDPSAERVREALKRAAAVCDEQAHEWDSDRQITDKNYAAHCAERIRALSSSPAEQHKGEV